MSEPRNPKNILAGAFAALLCLICLFSNLGAIGLVGPDEPRYVWIARAMAETGDWITPRLYGTPWFEKPILYYWVAAIGFHLNLSPEWAGRLPSAIAALLAATTISWLGWKYYGVHDDWSRNPAILAPLIFSTSVAGIAFARAATPDMLFAASLTVAMACAAAALGRNGALPGQEAAPPTEPQRDFTAVALFGACLGLSVLAKGPAGVILAGGAIAQWALLARKWQAALRLAHPAAIVAFAAVALPWYLICALRNPDFIHVFIFQHNFERYLTPVFQHQQPFWFFAPIIILALLPWSVFLWGGLPEGVRLYRENCWPSSPGFFFSCWAIFPVVFFSFSQSKLPSYILPAIPPLALLASMGAIRAFEKSRGLGVTIAAGTALVWVALSIYLLHTARFAAMTGALHAHLALGVAITIAAPVVAASLIWGGYRQDLPVTVGICCVAAVAALETANLLVLPHLDPAMSARPYAEMLRNDLHPDRIFTFQLKRSWSYGLTFYFKRELPEWSPEDPDAALVLTTREGFEKIMRAGRFRGALEEQTQGGLLYVPVEPAPR
jgi:4-amino-4-deoxy-L-arabinose transferase-like glycosyltransferase